ncbi:MAG: thiamine pyrophosphate-dependent enzyme, partial [Pseudomonadota bacterium]
IDVQAATVDLPATYLIRPRPAAAIAEQDESRLVAAALKAQRPMLLLGGGARHASAEATALADAGFGIVTSTNGRAIVAEDHAMSLGAFNIGPETQALYDASDLLIIVGSRLRSNETLGYKMQFPQRTILIDCDPAAQGRCYATDDFICADAKSALACLQRAAIGGVRPAPTFKEEIAAARCTQIEKMRDGLGPYAELVDRIQGALPDDAVWVRDVTIANSVWGNRYLRFKGSRNGVHAVGGGIGQGAPMAVGAALGANGRRVVGLVGDGGTSLCLGELQTLVEERARATIILMNDKGYGVIKNIQDVQYGERRYYSDIETPDFAKICEGVGLPHTRVSSLPDFSPVFESALKIDGPMMIEVDMTSIGPMRNKFAGPPKKTL